MKPITLVALSLVGASGCGRTEPPSFPVVHSSSCPVEASVDPELVCDGSASTVLFAVVYSEVLNGFRVNPPGEHGGICTHCHTLDDADGSGAYGDFATADTAYAMVDQVSRFAGSDRTLKVVDPTDLANSSIWLKALGRPTARCEQDIGHPMPMEGESLTAAQKTTLKSWICSGAQR